MTPGTPTVNAGEDSRDLRYIPCADNRSGISAIRYSAGVMDRIRRRATEQFLSIPRGGLEVGGLLYGLIENEEILILDFTEVTLEYVSGPSFHLSPQDEIELQKAIRSEHSLSVVGWWHSHTRSDTAITDEDRTIHARHFGTHAPLAMILKPHKFDPAQVAVYIAGATEASCRFVSGDKEQPQRGPAIVVAPPPPAKRPPTPPPQPEPVHYVAVASQRPLTTRRTRIARVTGATLVFLGTAVGTALLRTGPVIDPVRLDLAKSSSGLTIRWSVDAPVAATASSAELTIVDERGKARTLELRPNEVRAGSLMYDRVSEKLQIRLRVRSEKNEIHDATANFLGDPQSEPVTVVKAATPPPREPRPLPRVKEEPVVTRTTEPTPPVAVRPVAQLTPPPAAPREVPSPQIAPPPSLQLAGVAAPAMAVNIPAAPVTLPKPAARKLASGRAIWTGTLTAGSTVLIDGARPTMGSLTGSLPNRPARVRVRAADLLESGLVIYTPSGEERLERPSASNGWNLTTWRPDARRSESIAVLEAPSESNEWQRIMIRTNNRTLSALVIDWDELPSQ